MGSYCIEHVKYKMTPHFLKCMRSFCGKVAKLLDYDSLNSTNSIICSLSATYPWERNKLSYPSSHTPLTVSYVHFQPHILGKGMNSLIPPAMG